MSPGLDANSFGYLIESPTMIERVRAVKSKSYQYMPRIRKSAQARSACYSDMYVSENNLDILRRPYLR